MFFIGGPDPIPLFYLGDANCDASVDVSDAVWIINLCFVGGDPPPVVIPIFRIKA
jgi:hypothetical protein